MVEETPLQSAVESELVLQLDPEPLGLRLTQLLLLFVGFVIGYMLTITLVPTGSACSPLGLLVGGGLGGIMLQASEYLLVPRWKSNKFLHVSPAQIHVQHGDRQEQIITPSGDMSLYMWYFEVKRKRARIPQGWFMVALAVEEDDIYIPTYCLISPEQFEALPFRERFTELISRKEVQAAKGDTMRIAGLQRRLLRAEGARDLHGVEMVYEDFKTFVHWLDMHFPELMPSR